MPQNDGINWDEFFKVRDASTAIVDKERNNYELAKQRHPSPEEILIQEMGGNSTSATNKTVNLQNKAVGDFMIGSNPGKRLNLSEIDQITNHNQMMSSSSMQQDDPFKFAKPFDFNGTQYGQFFDRYYNHPKFKKLGFSPFRDNETYYNANSTQWDDFNRMRTQWGSLFWDGYTGLAQNWGNFSLAGDLHHAANMEKAMGIAMSSKKGPGAFVTNLAGNSAYTFGILGEIATEEAALALISLIPGTQEFTVPRAGMNVVRAFNALKKGIKGYKPLSKLIKGLTDVNQTRSFVNGFTKYGKEALKFINPLENTYDWLKNAENLKNLDKLSDAAIVSRGVGAFYRDMRGINAAWDEATLEGGMVENELTNNLLNEYYKKNGHLPLAGSEDANKIYRMASEGGRLTSLANIPAIAYSNKIVFERPLRPLMKNVKADLGQLKNVKGWTIKEIKEAGNITYKAVEKNIVNTVKDFKTLPIKTLKGGFKYLSANLTEGFQETYQEGLSAGMKKHYEEIYSNPQMAGLREQWWHSFDEGVQSQMSMQGLDVFLSGALMGGLVQPVQKVMFETVPHYSEEVWASKVFGTKGQERRNVLDAKKKARKEYVENLANSMTVVANASETQKKQLFNLIYENAVNQRNIGLMIEDAMEGRARTDKKAALDATTEGLALHLHTLAEGGKLHIFRDQVESMKGLNDEELANMIGVDPKSEEGGKVRDRITKVVNQIDLYEKKLKAFDERYGSKRIRDAVDAAAYSRAKRDFIYNTFALEDTLNRLDDLQKLVANNKSLATLNPSDYTVLLSNNAASNMHIKFLQSQVALGKSPDATAEIKKQGNIAESQLRKISLLRGHIQTVAKLERELAEYKKSNNPTQEGVNQFEDQINKGYATVRKHFTKYANYLGKKTGNTPLQNDIDDVIDLIVDHHRLNHDKDDFINSINLLADPGYFQVYADQIKTALKEVEKNQAENIKKGLNEFMKIKDTNKLYQDLANLKLFITTRGIEELKKGQMPILYKIPVDYDNVTPENVKDTDALNPLSKDPLEKEAYQKAMELFHDYEYVHGVSLTGKELPQDISQLTDDAGTLLKRIILKDTRTLRDYYKLLGIAYKDKAATLTAAEVIDKLFDSLYTDPVSRALLNALKILVTNNDKVVFVRDQNQAVVYDPATSTLRVDLRYFSADYDKGKGYMEGSIIKGLLIMPATREYNQDPEFKKKIDSLFDRATEWFKKASLTQKKKLGFPNDFIIPYGFTSKEAFIAEAINNPGFQNILGNIKSDAKPGNIFKQFITAIKEAIKKFIIGDTTLLDEALDIISVKFFEGKTVPAITEYHPDLQNIIYGIKSYVLNDVNKLLTDPTFVALHGKLTAYKNTVKGYENVDLPTFIQNSKGDPEIGKIVNAYIKEIEPVIKSGLKKDTDQPVDERIDKLRELGYTEKQIDQIMKMSDQEIANILDYHVRGNLDKPVPLITPSTKEEVELALKNLNAKKLKLSADETVYQNVQNPADEYARISELNPDKKDIDDKRAAKRGTIIDRMLRAFVDGKVTSVEDLKKIYAASSEKDETQRFTDGFIENLFNIFSEVKKSTDDAGITLIADIPTLWGIINGKKYAGTIDLLGIGQDGTVYIIDLKTSSHNRRDPNDPYYENYKQSDTYQQSGYAELIRQRTGITVKKITVFPVQTTVSKGAYAKAEANKDENGNLTMNVDIDKNIFPDTPYTGEEDTDTDVDTDTDTDTDSGFIVIPPVFQGQLVYATPGSGKSTLAKKYPGQIIDLDDHMTEIYNYLYNTNITPEEIGEAIYELGPEIDSFYDIAAERIKDILEENPDKVLVTGTHRFLTGKHLAEKGISIGAMMITSNDEELTGYLKEKNAVANRNRVSRGEKAIEKSKTLAKSLQNIRESELEGIRKIPMYEIDNYTTERSVENALSGKVEATPKILQSQKIFDSFTSAITKASTKKKLEALNVEINDAWYATDIDDSMKLELQKRLAEKDAERKAKRIKKNPDLKNIKPSSINPEDVDPKIDPNPDEIDNLDPCNKQP